MQILIRVLSFLAYCSFGFFLCRLPLVATWSVGQPLRGLPLDHMPGYFGESKYLPFFGVYLTSWIESSKPNTRESACKKGGLETGLGYVDVLGP